MEGPIMIVYHINGKCEWSFEATNTERASAQLDELLYKWFTAMHSIGKPLTGPMIIQKVSVYGEM